MPLRPYTASATAYPRGARCRSRCMAISPVTVKARLASGHDVVRGSRLLLLREALAHVEPDEWRQRRRAANTKSSAPAYGRRSNQP
jgi:hypothetical protein